MEDTSRDNSSVGSIVVLVLVVVAISVAYSWYIDYYEGVPASNRVSNGYIDVTIPTYTSTYQYQNYQTTPSNNVPPTTQYYY